MRGCCDLAGPWQKSDQDGTTQYWCSMARDASLWEAKRDLGYSDLCQCDSFCSTVDELLKALIG